MAGISSRQRRGLKDGELGTQPGRIATRRGLAALDTADLPKLDWSSRPALERVREQARIQVEGEDRGEMLWELLEPEWARGRRRARRRASGLSSPTGASSSCPSRRPHDLFLDLEGDPFAFDDGIDYLFGVLDPSTAEDDVRWARLARGDAPPRSRPRSPGSSRSGAATPRGA